MITKSNFEKAITLKKELELLKLELRYVPKVVLDGRYLPDEHPLSLHVRDHHVFLTSKTIDDKLYALKKLGVDYD